MRSPDWKSKWLQQRKKDHRNTDLRTYKYRCTWGHIRIEKVKLKEKDPSLMCQACSNEGKTSPFKYIGIHTMTRTDSKKSKFKN
jgi:predicted nucleic acid-binding Zn ribbon protein